MSDSVALCLSSAPKLLNLLVNAELFQTSVCCMSLTIRWGKDRGLIAVSPLFMFLAAGEFEAMPLQYGTQRARETIFSHTRLRVQPAAPS
jgi:hypothetical protein